MPRNKLDGPMKVGIEGFELVIRVGVDRLADCLAKDDGPMKGCWVTNQIGAAADIARAMSAEDESGNGPLWEFVSAMAGSAVSEGSVNIDPPPARKSGRVERPGCNCGINGSCNICYQPG